MTYSGTKYPNRISSLDFIKGISIIGIILYHFGFLTFGYLGVDVFLVISGFLIIPSVIKHLELNDFSLLKWLYKRLVRFLPLILIISAVGLILGYFLMLPDDFENLSESVFATNIFGNNILQLITVKNYWNFTNEYKPLLATWYLGVLFQLFIILGIIFTLFGIVIKKVYSLRHHKHFLFFFLLAILSGCSFLAFIFSNDSFETKFYSPLYRGWEFGVGGLVYYLSKYFIIREKVPFFVLIIGLICIFSLGFIYRLLSIPEFFNKSVLQIIAVFFGCILLNCRATFRHHNLMIVLGKMSLSLFLWHQFILAFFRYLFTDNFTIQSFLIVLSIICVISIISYKYFESYKLSRLYSRIIAFVVWSVILSSSYYFYSVAGVVRDIKELGITTKQPYIIRNTEFIDRFYGYNSPLLSDKIKVLAIGNSFARDFLACLEEWDTENKIEISYKFDEDWDDPRLETCDFIFYTERREDLLPLISSKIKPETQIYGIGTKSYGKSLGPIYNRRFSKDYHNYTVRIDDSIIDRNKELKESWGEDKYIDFISIVSCNGKDVHVFTPEGMFISFDGMHLTEDGAKYYAKRIDFEKIFRLKPES